MDARVDHRVTHLVVDLWRGSCIVLGEKDFIRLQIDSSEEISEVNFDGSEISTKKEKSSHISDFSTPWFHPSEPPIPAKRISELYEDPVMFHYDL